MITALPRFQRDKLETLELKKFIYLYIANIYFERYKCNKHIYIYKEREGERDRICKINLLSSSD